MPEDNRMISQLMTQVNRLEGKVDTVQAAIVQMAKTEERVVRLMEADQKKTDWILQLQERVNIIEKAEIGKNAITSRVERFTWMVATAAITAAVAYYFGGA